jgi:hypothetical protein
LLGRGIAAVLPEKESISFSEKTKSSFVGSTKTTEARGADVVIKAITERYSGI